MKDENVHAYRVGTDHGEIKFGHIHDDGVFSAVLIRSGADAGRHYFQMDSSGSTEQGRNGGTIACCPGTFQINCGESVAKDIPGFKVSSKGDVLINAPGKRVKIIAANIELIAEGSDGKNGLIMLDSNEKVVIKSTIVDIRSKVSTSVVSEKTVDVIGRAILNIYGGLIDAADGATKINGSKPCAGPYTNEEKNKK